MAEAHARLVQLGKVLALEARQGYEDRAVFGGLDAYVAALSADLGADVAEALQQHAQHYASKPHPERVAAVRELLDVLRRPALNVEVTEVERASPPTSAARKTLAPAAAPQPALPPLDAPVSQAKGVGKERQRALNTLGITTIEALLLSFPRRIEDRSQTKKIAQLRPGDRVTVRGTVRSLETINPKGKLNLLKAAVQEGSGLLYAVWFNQPWLKTQLKVGQAIALFGEVTNDYGQRQLSNPVWEPAQQALFTGRLVPVYPATKGMNQATFVRLVHDNVKRYREHLPDVLPEEVRERAGLMPRATAIYNVHFPASVAQFERAREALAFEELFLFQLGVVTHKERARAEQGRALVADEEAFDTLEAALPFRLTGAQRRALREIRADLTSPHPMNRLLQGDVGSGKTVVAAAACYVAIKAGYQACLMAPTEILAQQHLGGLRALLEPLGVRCALLSGGLKAAEAKTVRTRVAAGEVDLLIGTHALIEDTVQFAQLGLVVIDEQHRFGVIQRAQLERKGHHVDVLVMSATPIPRTIMLTLYGQFEVSILDELPFEKRINTYWINEAKRQEVYALVATEVKQGTQAYIVCPLVEESEDSDLRAAVQMKEELEATYFSGLRVGLLHGRMKDAQKQAVMQALRQRQIDVLVSTTVVEVGIDVPDASLMVIEHAERFGLSQLHQLRGRIGRAGQKSLCFAIGTAKTDEARARLRVFQEHLDGFKIAEADLEIRGPGELLGLAQSGLDTTFRAANLVRDLELMQRARDEAARHLKGHPNSPLLELFERRFGHNFSWARF